MTAGIDDRAAAVEDHLAGGGRIEHGARRHPQAAGEGRRDGLDGLQGAGRGHGHFDHPGAAVVHGLGVGEEVVLRLQLDAGQHARGLGLLDDDFPQALIAATHGCHRLILGCLCKSPVPPRGSP